MSDFVNRTIVKTIDQYIQNNRPWDPIPKKVSVLKAGLYCISGLTQTNSMS